MAIGKLISAEALISTKTMSIPTTKPTNIQSTTKDKVHINKIETTPITGNREREDHKSKIFPSDARANPRLAHASSVFRPANACFACVRVVEKQLFSDVFSYKNGPKLLRNACRFFS